MISESTIKAAYQSTDEQTKLAVAELVMSRPDLVDFINSAACDSLIALGIPMTETEKIFSKIIGGIVACEMLYLIKLEEKRVAARAAAELN